MVWDFGKAMRKKEEFESARLIDFEFRQRARAACDDRERASLAEHGVEQGAVATPQVQDPAAARDQARDELEVAAKDVA